MNLEPKNMSRLVIEINLCLESIEGVTKNKMNIVIVIDFIFHPIEITKFDLKLKVDDQCLKSCLEKILPFSILIFSL